MEGGGGVNHDEQRVRTMAGWVGVKISRSRVRTEGKAGYGLYRVRGSVAARQRMSGGYAGPSYKVSDSEPTEWTAYAFGLEEIGAAVRMAIERGLPRTPEVLRLGPADDPTWVPTRWTQAYRGRRDLGETLLAAGKVDPGTYGRLGKGLVELLNGGPTEAMTVGEAEAMVLPVAVKPEFAALVTAVDSLVGAGLVEMVHVEGCCCDDDRYAAACIQATAPGRQVQRAGNAAFQAEHLKAREWGLRARYAAKRGRLGGSQHSGEQLGPQSGSEGDSGPR